MDILTTLILGGLVAGVTQLMKKLIPSVPPLYWVACLAIIGGSLWAIVMPILPVEYIEKIGLAFSTAIAFYEVLKGFLKD